VLVGSATRVAEYLVEWDKEYRAVMRLGETTDTQDATGTVQSRVDASGVPEDAIHRTIDQFRGLQRQLPPMYSAVKVGGRPLYKSARAGKTVERQERQIVIHALKVLGIAGRDVTLSVVCSKGTYIRTLCADIGESLGVGGHLLSLVRERVGPLSIDHALPIEHIAQQAGLGRLADHLIAVDQVLEQLPALVLTVQQAERVLHGGAVSPFGMGELPSLPGRISVRLKDESGRLLAIGTHVGGTSGSITIDKVLIQSQSLN
jgi:tRNA pseudouridine55 synthase